MKQLVSGISLLIICLIFSGCPYESHVPIDVPSIKINPKLLGNWTPVNHKEELYKITKQDEFTYKIQKKDSMQNEAEEFSAYTSLVGGISFLNLWDSKEEAGSRKYSLYKMDTSKDGLITLAEVTDNIDEQFSSSAALRKFIGANMKNSYFFNKEESTYSFTGK